MITQENHDKYDVDPDTCTRKEFRESLEQHNEFFDYLGLEVYGDKDPMVDMGADYANWLNNRGVHHQSKNGWLNKAALDQDNIQLYIDHWNGDISDGMESALIKTRDIIKSINNAGRFIPNSNKVTDIVKAITGYSE